MLKNIKLLTKILLLVLILPITVLADDVEIVGTDVGIRKQPGVFDDSLITRVNNGVKYALKSNNKVADTSPGGDCRNGWYQIDYSGITAYVCSDFARVVPTQNIVIDTTSCETELTTKGFPQSYVKKLCVLKAQHPNWTFNPVQTGMDFKNVVEKESACGKNTINTSIAEYKDLSCWGNYDSGYVSASQTAVAYFLNPLNFMDDSHIFMFESNYVNQDVSDDTFKIVTPGILGSFMVNNLPQLTTSLNLASREKNVSQVMLSARIRQELGDGRATAGAYAGGLLSCISGNYTSRWGTLLNGESMDYYYNFFNVGVYDGSNGDAAFRAVRYAKLSGWGGTGDQTEDLKRAIGGGADFLKSRYMDKGQDTIYFQKFNVHPTSASSLYVNQYMTNIEAPRSESEIIASAYKSKGAIDNKFVFLIPVFNNMEENISNSSNGGTGETPSDNTSKGIDIPTILVGSGYKLSGNVISGIAVGTTIEDFKNKINALGGVVTGDATGLIGTGKKIKINNGVTTTEYVFVVKGDTSGDGQINALDLLQVQKTILNQYNMSNESRSAADTSGDGQINALDLLQVQKSILGQYNIAQ